MQRKREIVPTWSVVVVDADWNEASQIGHRIPTLNSKGHARMTRVKLYIGTTERAFISLKSRKSNKDKPM